jgi:undecaprenyl diphosphate synthase
MADSRDIWERFPVLKDIPEDKFPKHIFITPDGNGRWAQMKKLPRNMGHAKGAEVVEALLRDMSQISAIRYVTIWGFSSDNWKRSLEEVNGLMDIIKKSIQKTADEVKSRGSRFMHIGRKDRFSPDLVEVIEKLEEETKHNTNQTIVLAIDYGGEDQLRRMIDKARKLDPSIETTPELIVSLRDGNGELPPADLMIRTSGEKRTSDVGWLNNAGTELYFLEKLFPDCGIEDIVEAIVSFSKRDRRLGKESGLVA